MSQSYRPQDYWERRLQGRFDLRGVGHRSFSAFYNRWLYKRKARCLSRALRGIPVQGATVLDVGCGTGFFVDWYLRHGATVSGIDITEVSIARLRERFPGDFRTQDIGAADYVPPAPVDIVNMWDVMYHIVEPEAFDRTLRNVAASLKPGGHFLTTDWLGAPADTRVADHVQARCLATYTPRLTKLGFEQVALHPLYQLLNERRLAALDDLLAPIYYLLDDRAKKISRTNLSLGVWRKK